MAGLRTNALVAAGATLFVLYAVAANDVGSPTRVASYVVSGVGFLGGGVILREGFNVRGRLERLLAELSLQPGVSAVHWYADDQTTLTPPAPPPD